MRVLGVDWGEKRIGVAVSDELGIAARGLAVVQTLADVVGLVKQENAGRVVVGMPIHDDGTPSKSAPKVLTFVEALRSAVTVPVGGIL